MGTTRVDESWDTMVGSLAHVMILSGLLDGREFSTRIDFCCEATEKLRGGDNANTRWCFQNNSVAVA